MHQLGHLVDERVMAADNDERILDLLARTQQANLNGISRFMPLAVLQNGKDAVGFHE